MLVVVFTCSAIEEFVAKLSEAHEKSPQGQAEAQAEVQAEAQARSEETLAELDRRHQALLDEEYGASGRNG